MQLLTSFGDGGRQPGQFYGVHSIAVDSQGNIYTTETWEGKRIQKFVNRGLGAGHHDAPGHRLAAFDALAAATIRRSPPRPRGPQKNLRALRPLR